MARTAKVRNYLTKSHSTRKPLFIEEDIDVFLNETIDNTTNEKKHETSSIDTTTNNTDWDDIELLMKSLTIGTSSGTTKMDKTQEFDPKNVSELLHVMSNMDHNSSGMFLKIVL